MGSEGPGLREDLRPRKEGNRLARKQTDMRKEGN